MRPDPAETLPPAARCTPPPAWLVAALLFIALGHAGLAHRAMGHKSSTSDEIGHVTGGYAFNVLHDYRLHPENGLLPQRWQALPAAWADTPFPALDQPEWRHADVWALGHQFFYEVGNDPARLLAGARAMNTVFGAATILLVGWWAWRLGGAAGALVAALFAALCPTMLAHSALATSDMAMAFFLTATVTACWCHWHDGRKRLWLLSIVVFGLACVAKFTAVLLLPILALLGLARALRSAPVELAGRQFTTPAARTGALALSLALHGAGAVLFIWAFAGFRFSAFNPALPAGGFSLPWNFVLSFGGFKATVITVFRDWHLLPEGWLYGLAFVLKHAEARGAFLDGNYSIFGWVDFFPRAFLYKTPPALLAALLVAAGLVVLRVREQGRKLLGERAWLALPLLVLFVVYWGFSLTSKLNIGHRHILPTYPVLYVGAGLAGWAAVRAWRRSRAGGVVAALLVAGLLGWQTAAARGIHPHYLAYFSPLFGGPDEGYRRLVDSSLDWGQDLPGLADWLREHRQPGETVHLSYFGTGEPLAEGIHAVQLPALPIIKEHPWYEPTAGLYCISATMLQHVYSPIRGPWTNAWEQEYQTLRSLAPSLRAFATDPAAHPDLLQTATAAQWRTTAKRYDLLRFARLCHYLRTRRPIAMIGYSILVYRLDQSEVDAALAGDLRALITAVERAGATSP